MHIFEAAGLGTAPFKYLGYEKNRLTGCQYCGTAIMYRFYLKSADGKTFFVGSDCILKSGDAGLRKSVDKVKAEINRAKRDADAAEARETLCTVLGSDILSDIVRDFPHPKGFSNLTLLDYAEWMKKNAGDSGRIATAKMLRKALG